MATTRQFKPKAHVIIDIETLSLDRHAAITEIAALGMFGTHAVGQSFSIKIRPSSYDQLPAFVRDPETIAFHDRENPFALKECEDDGKAVKEALQALAEYLAHYSHPYELHVWSQGKDFDFPILEHAYKAFDMQIPWNYRNVHCLRDLVFLNPRSRIQPSKGVKHRALDDVLHAHKQFTNVIADSTWYQRLFQ